VLESILELKANIVASNGIVFSTKYWFLKKILNIVKKNIFDIWKTLGLCLVALLKGPKLILKM